MCVGRVVEKWVRGGGSGCVRVRKKWVRVGGGKVVGVEEKVVKECVEWREAGGGGKSF